MLRGDMRGNSSGDSKRVAARRAAMLTTVLGALLGAAIPCAPALAAPGQSAVAAVPAITGIRAGSHPDRLRVVLDATAAPLATTGVAATLERGGSRLTVELPGAVWHLAESGTLPSGAGWRAVPTAHSVRLSIDLARPAAAVSTAVLPGAGRAGQRLVIDLAPARPAQADAAGTNTAGTNAAGTNAAGTVVASDLTPRPRSGKPRELQVASRLAMPRPAEPGDLNFGLTQTAPGGGFAVSLGFVPSETALRLGMAPEKPQDAPGGGNPLEGSASTSLMGNPMDMDWGFESGSFALKMSGPGDDDLQIASRLRFKDKSLTLGVIMPF